jgi:Uma2 family endonuclease
MTTTKPITAEELLLMPRGNGRRYELTRGVLVEKMPTGHPHGVAVKWITFALAGYEAETGYGSVITGEPGYRHLLDHTLPIPIHSGAN